MCPTFRSWSISPATAEETHTTAATPRTAATPWIPLTPMMTIVSAAMTVAASVRPEIGLFDDPISPTRFPETAAKKPVMSMTIAASIAPTNICVK